MTASSVLVGVSGAHRNACASLYADGQVKAICEQERLTRIRGVGLAPRHLPREAVDQVLALGGCGEDEVAAYVFAEDGINPPPTLPAQTVDHHQAHAATAFLTSPFDRAAVLVCDDSPGRPASVWTGGPDGLVPHSWPTGMRGLAATYSGCARLFQFSGNGGAEPGMEALAHLGRDDQAGALRKAFVYRDGELHADPGWQSLVAGSISEEQRRGRQYAVDTARAVQQQLGDVLIECARDVKAATGCDALCVGGGLFYNTWFTTRLRQSHIFSDVFVPANPGNAGVAIGATLSLASHARGHAPDRMSPFLGPGFDDQAVKAALDSCKLSYSYGDNTSVIDSVVASLEHGELVGWFDGRMEWGHKALGHRSILADPCSPFVLENLNGYLRKRQGWRRFGVSVREEEVHRFFDGPPRSRFMEFEYTLRDDRLRQIMPAGATSVRVQTVPRTEQRFWQLHARMADATGVGVLVNTSLNGFHEPIACTPFDAIRVFFGSGLDMLAIGGFTLRK